MRAEFFGKRLRFLLPTLLCALLIVGTPILTNNVHSQSNKLILVSEETSTRAVAVDSVTQKHEPFSTSSTVPWGFFFQAEDGIRAHCVTGVQTCALPISWMCMPVTITTSAQS